MCVGPAGAPRIELPRNPRWLPRVKFAVHEYVLAMKADMLSRLVRNTATSDRATGERRARGQKSGAARDRAAESGAIRFHLQLSRESSSEGKSDGGVSGTSGSVGRASVSVGRTSGSTSP